LSRDITEGCPFPIPFTVFGHSQKIVAAAALAGM
jgi:hypothetical protein